MGPRLRATFAALLAAPLAAGPASAVVPQDPPAAREVDALVEEYVALDGRSASGMRRQDEILARLDGLEPLSAREAERWRKRIHKLWAKGPKLEKKSGRRFLWEEPERGLYIVGGEDRRPKGLLVAMHGGGVGEGDAWSSHGAFQPAASKQDWLALYPEVLEKTEHGWTDSGTEEFVLELLERALRTWDVDRDRVYFAGHSMGGYGTWTLGAHHADLVAALAPSAGAPTPILERGVGVVGIDAGVVPNLRNVPMVIYQSDDDPQVPPDVNRAAVKELEAARARWGGFEHEYWEEPGRAHDEPPGGMRALVEKIAARRRNARPDKVVWQPALSWKRQLYWLWWDQPRAGAIVEAELDREANAVRVRSEAPLQGLHVLLDDDLLDLDRELTVETNGTVVWSGKLQRSLAAVLLSACHGDEARTYEARVAVAP